MKKIERQQQSLSTEISTRHSVERFLKINEVATMFGVSTRSVWRLVASGEFPNRVKIRRCVRLPESDVCSYLEKSKLR